MCKSFIPLPCVVMVLAAVTAVCRTPAASASQIQENIADTTYIDSRNNTTNYSTGKIKLVANAMGTGSNDGSITRALFSLPADLATVPAADVASARIYFYNYGVSPPNYSQPNPPAYTVPDVRLYPLSQSFSAGNATWSSSTTGTAWSTPWTTPYNSSGVGGPFDAAFHADAVDVGSGGLPTANGWSYFDVTSLWSNADFLSNGVVMMLANEVVPADPNNASTHEWLTENWATRNYTPTTDTPYIVVNTVPEPSTLAMVLAGTVLLTTFLGKRWARQRR